MKFKKKSKYGIVPGRQENVLYVNVPISETSNC